MNHPTIRRHGVEIVATMLCLMPVAQLLLTRRTDGPYSEYSWAVFLVWMAPIVLQIARREWRCRVELLVISMSCLIAGQAGAIHHLCYLASALAVAAWCSQRVTDIPWVLSCVAWMPVFGWLFRSLPASSIPALRLTFVIFGLLLSLSSLRALQPEGTA